MEERSTGHNLSPLLKGKALDVCALMPVEQALDYDITKATLLKRGFQAKV